MDEFFMESNVGKRKHRRRIDRKEKTKKIFPPKKNPSYLVFVH